MLITPDGVDLCDFDPGYPEYASVEGDLRILGKSRERRAHPVR